MSWFGKLGGEKCVCLPMKTRSRETDGRDYGFKRIAAVEVMQTHYTMKKITDVKRENLGEKEPEWWCLEGQKENEWEGRVASCAVASSRETGKEETSCVLTGYASDLKTFFGLFSFYVYECLACTRVMQSL